MPAVDGSTQTKLLQGLLACWCRSKHAGDSGPLYAIKDATVSMPPAGHVPRAVKRTPRGMKLSERPSYPVEFQEEKKKGHPWVPQDRYAIAPGGRMQMS